MQNDQSDHRRIKLDVNTFEEIEHDESALSQAVIVVALVHC